LLAARELHVTPSQLDRWRSGGYLPPNKREGLGRGAGSRSETVAGVADYTEALAFLARQGRSMQQVMLTLFMAGIVQPDRFSADDPLGKAYEAAIRRVFRTEIHQGAKAWNRVTARLAEGRDRDEAEDKAFAEAEAIGKLVASRRQIRLETEVTALGSSKPRTPAEIGRDAEQAVLAATGLIPPRLKRDEGDRGFQEIWHTGFLPLDATIMARPDCPVCTSKTAFYPTSPQGQQDILDSSSFTELNRARAIGGAVGMVVASVREAALKKPDDKALRGMVALIENTVFNFFLREPRLIDPRYPRSIVRCAMTFLIDCRWLRSAAALLVEDALNQSRIAVGDPAILVEVGRLFVEAAGRTAILRQFEEGVGILLVHDGLAEAVKLIKSGQMHQE
jgi:hypothetical protein